MTKLKKILILVDWFSPGYKAGGPIRSCVNFCTTLKHEYEIYVLTTDTDHGEIKPYNDITTNTWIFNNTLGVYVYYAKRLTLTTKQLATQIDFINADFVYLNHLFSPYFVVYPIWLKFRNKIQGKVIVSPRGALYDSALSLKKYKKQPLLYIYRWLDIHKLVIFHATNLREQEAIKCHFSKSKVIVADNLSATDQPIFSSNVKEAGKLKCIFIARIVPIKNILFLLQQLQHIKLQIELTIVGPVEDELYWEDCKKNIKQLPANITINYLGAQKNEVLADLIQAHHLFILPTTGENFGHSIFEALLNGRPVLISDQTPWLNLEAQNTGWDVPLNEPEKFISIINKMAAFDQAEFDVLAKGAWQYANKFINNVAAKQQYLNLFS